MIVILNRDIKGTGKAGDVVNVSDGYARNMLLPKGYATEATEGNIRSLKKQKAIAAEKKAEKKPAEKKKPEPKPVPEKKPAADGQMSLMDFGMAKAG